MVGLNSSGPHKECDSRPNTQIRVDKVVSIKLHEFLNQSQIRSVHATTFEIQTQRFNASHGRTYIIPDRFYRTQYRHSKIHHDNNAVRHRAKMKVGTA